MTDLTALDFTPTFTCEAADRYGNPGCDRPGTWVMRMRPPPCEHVDAVQVLCDGHLVLVASMSRTGAVCCECDTVVPRACVVGERLNRQEAL